MSFSRRLQQAAVKSSGAAPATPYPDSTNTGPAATTVFDNNGGSGWAPADFYGSASGTTWDGYIINCTYPMEFPAGDAGKTITFKNCVFNDGGVYWMVLNDVGMPNLIFDHCEFAGVGAANSANDAALNGSNMTLRYCNIHSCGDGMKIGSNIVFEYNWVHDLYVTGSSHNDGIQSLGTAGNGTEGSGAYIYHNFFDASNGATCITLSTGSASDMRDVLTEDNLLSCNGYSINGGYAAGVDTLSKVSDLVYRNNKLKNGTYLDGGGYPFTSTDSPVVVTGTTWYDGPNAGQPVWAGQ